MSAGSLNGGSLAVSKLTIGGQTFTGASGLAGLLGSASGSVATTAGTVNVSVATGAQTGVLTTASTMVLPPAGGGGGGNVNATTATSGTPLAWSAGVYNPGDMVIDNSPGGAKGVYICSATTSATGTGSGAPNTLNPSYWNLLVAPITNFTGDNSASVPTESQNLTISVSASAQTGVLTTATDIILPPAGSGAGNMVATTATTGSPLEWATGVYNPGDVVRDGAGLYICSATTSATGASSGAPNTLVPSYWNTLVAPASGSGIAIARGTITMAAQGAGGTGTVGVLASPTGAEVLLVALSGTLPASFSPTNTWMVSWAGDNSGTPVAPPAQAPIAPAPPASGTATSATFNCSGAILAGAKLNWVLY